MRLRRAQHHPADTILQTHPADTSCRHHPADAHGKQSASQLCTRTHVSTAKAHPRITEIQDTDPASASSFAVETASPVVLDAFSSRSLNNTITAPTR